MVKFKATKASDFYASSAHDSLADLVNQLIGALVDGSLRKMGEFIGKSLYQFGFYHTYPNFMIYPKYRRGKKIFNPMFKA